MGSDKSIIEETNSLPLVFDLGLGYGLFERSLKIGANVYKQLDMDIDITLGEYGFTTLFRKDWISEQGNS